ncbi:hypothetical protein RRG08_016218 [Elysia crispata]|uniref:Uncharacterized protein n=1 Tax=Elysia crispata TaxID=231223 RepID=A0AAE1DKG5_9GAST|nr:hypothetical protein RRG08_016218 [Elysia crispata]
MRKTYQSTYNNIFQAPGNQRSLPWYLDVMLVMIVEVYCVGWYSGSATAPPMAHADLGLGSIPLDPRAEHSTRTSPHPQHHHHHNHILVVQIWFKRSLTPSDRTDCHIFL